MKKIFIFTLVSVLLLSASCSKFDDMSKNPYALYEAPAESFVHPIMFKTQYNLISVFRSSTILLMQYGVSTNSEVSSKVIDNYNIPEGTTDDIWSGLYPQLGNAVKMYDTAVKENNPSMQAVALILKSFIITQIADTYGDVPFKEAGALITNSNAGYYTAYDSQKDIYRSVVVMLEKANDLLANSTVTSFSAVCDKTFGGDLDKWRRFGNSLYARVLMRISLKVIEEDGGILDVSDIDSEIGAIAVKSKLDNLYACFTSKGGDYPQMRSRADRPLVPFSDQNEPEHTPFYTTTSGNWNAVAVSDVLTRAMLDYTQATDSNGQVYYQYKASTDGGHVEDPRYDCWWRKANGMPVQLLNADRVAFLAAAEHKSQAGNSKIGRMVFGKDANGNPSPSAITGKVYDLQNAPYYPLMNYSELVFIYAEALARGWIDTDNAGLDDCLKYFKDGITESILEWNPYVTEKSSEVDNYVKWCANGEKYSGKTFNSSNAVEAILTQKWLAQFFVGIESWCDYRRTGYPLLKTNGLAAVNNNILPTRMRYPSDEQYRNPSSYPAAVNGWLGGTNNIQTDVWWANTAVSTSTRLLGRK